MLGTNILGTGTLSVGEGLFSLYYRELFAETYLIKHWPIIWKLVIGLENWETQKVYCDLLQAVEDFIVWWRRFLLEFQCV